MTIYLDTETTGLNHKTADVLEISIIDDDGNIRPLEKKS